MTYREKQIEEMAMSIAECNGTACENCALKCKAYITCEILTEHGYGNIEKEVKEFAEKLKDNLHHRDEEINIDHKWYTVEEYLCNQVDNLIKELYSEENK